jgi:hypothetical protein
VDPHNQDILILRAVEDADVALRRNSLVDADKKSRASSSAVGALNEVTSQPYGFTPDMTCRMVPSLPDASSPCKMISSE